MAKEKEQVEKTEEQAVEEQSSEELETLTEEEIAEQVSGLTDEQVETTEEQTEEVEESTEESSEEVETPVSMIDEEFVKLYPRTKAYFGKPVTELGKGYESIVEEFNKKSQQLAELKKKLAEATIPKLEDEPDPVDEKEAHTKWTEEREKAIRADERSKVAQQPVQVNYVTEVSKQLPNDVDAEKVIESWSNKNAYRLYDNLGNLKPAAQLLYGDDPNILVQEVVEYYNDNVRADKTDEEIRKAAHTKSKADFKKAKQTKTNMPKSEVHVVEREANVSEDEEQLRNIYKIVLEE